ncbi:hypothetical protein ABGT16_04360 [Pseudomonas asiatica]|uniref:hypothetical protein n=1 Tax=Pseudomonas asiatica TaxID=2219225 RepID=UPI00345D6C68
MANGKTFEPQGKYSSPSLDSTITLDSAQAIRVFRRCFETASHSLFVIDVISRALASAYPDPEFKQAEGAVSKMMEDMETKIAGEIGRINALLEAHGQGHQKPRYSNSESFTFAISSPVILRFASILVRFDEMYNRLDTAWLCGLVDSNKAQDFRREKLHWIQRIVRKLQTLSTSAIKRGRKAKLDQSMLDGLEKKSADAARQMDDEDNGTDEAAQTGHDSDVSASPPIGTAAVDREAAVA